MGPADSAMAGAAAAAETAAAALIDFKSVPKRMKDAFFKRDYLQRKRGRCGPLRDKLLGQDGLADGSGQLLGPLEQAENWQDHNEVGEVVPGEEHAPLLC